jgi:hypothetical protein
MAALTGQSCCVLVAQALLVDFNYVQRCQGFMTAVAVGCDPTASSRIGKRLRSLPREQPPRTSHLRADAGPCIAKW